MEHAWKDASIKPVLIQREGLTSTNRWTSNRSMQRHDRNASNPFREGRVERTPRDKQASKHSREYTQHLDHSS